jgi:hypothetical protein
VGQYLKEVLRRAAEDCFQIGTTEGMEFGRPCPPVCGIAQEVSELF